MNKQNKKTQKSSKKNPAEESKEIIDIAKLLIDKVDKSAKAVRQDSIRAHSMLIGAEVVVIGVIAQSLKKYSSKTGKTDLSISGRLTLMCALVQGISMCEEAILGGRYAQAAALLKQELEISVAMKEYRTSRRKQSKTPNVKNTHPQMYEFYKELNSVAHMATQVQINELYSAGQNEAEKSLSVVPLHKPAIAKQYLGRHVGILHFFVGELDLLFREMFGSGFEEKEFKALIVSLHILQKEEIISIPED